MDARYVLTRQADTKSRSCASIEDRRLAHAGRRLRDDGAVNEHLPDQEKTKRRQLALPPGYDAALREITTRARHPVEGADRSAVGFAWPALLRPSYDIKLVYLDLNHWINLAKAAKGHPDGRRFEPVLNILRSATTSGKAILPLSGSHYMEMSGIANHEWRQDIARVMEELSGFKTLMGTTVILSLEIEAALDRLAGPTAKTEPPCPLINFGVLRAFGKRGGLVVRDRTGRDVTEEAARQFKDGPEAFKTRLAEKEWEAERMFLEGPPAEKVPSLRADGWDPLVARAMADDRATDEKALAARLDADPKFRRGRIRDLISARYVSLRINDMLTRELTARGLDFDLFEDSRAKLRQFVDAMPSADVNVSLVAATHRNPHATWTTTTIFDIDALSIAVPYCDVVVTEKHFGHILRSKGIAERLGTRIVTNLAKLPDTLAG